MCAPVLWGDISYQRGLCHQWLLEVTPADAKFLNVLRARKTALSLNTLMCSFDSTGDHISQHF